MRYNSVSVWSRNESAYTRRNLHRSVASIIDCNHGRVVDTKVLQRQYIRDKSKEPSAIDSLIKSTQDNWF